MKKLIIALLAVAVCGLAFYLINSWYGNRLYRNKALVSGNGRLEATEVNVAAKLAGRVEKINVNEGDKVQAGQVIVLMQTNVLEADLAKAKAQKEQAQAAEASAKAIVDVKQASLDSMKANLEHARVAMNNAESNYKRYKTLITTNATSRQTYENAETNYYAKVTEYKSALADIKVAEANIKSAQADAVAARANIVAAEAEIARIQEDINDSILKAPVLGRIQYRVAEPGEVLAQGGRAINMIDLSDVYMTFFLSEEDAGKVLIGADVRIKLDAIPFAIPAKVTYVASDAQFTPKTVETRIERQKLMFRIKAHISKDMLLKFTDTVKTGLPGVAWVKIDPNAEWPKELSSAKELGLLPELEKAQKKHAEAESKINRAKKGEVFKK